MAAKKKPKAHHKTAPLPAPSQFDILEYCAIEEWKRDKPERLAVWLEKQPLSPMLRALVLDLIRDKPVRKRGAPKDLKRRHKIQHAIDLASVYDVHTKTLVDRVNGVPIKRPVRLVIEDAARLAGRSIKQIEKAYYRKPTRQHK